MKSCGQIKKKMNSVGLVFTDLCQKLIIVIDSQRLTDKIIRHFEWQMIFLINFNQNLHVRTDSRELNYLV